MPDLRRHRLGARHQVVGRAIATLSADGRFRDVVCHPKDGRAMSLTGLMARVTMIRSRIAERFPGLPAADYFASRTCSTRSIDPRWGLAGWQFG
jgi:hypothetical protein